MKITMMTLDLDVKSRFHTARLFNFDTIRLTNSLSIGYVQFSIHNIVLVFFISFFFSPADVLYCNQIEF